MTRTKGYFYFEFWTLEIVSNFGFRASDLKHALRHALAQYVVVRCES